MSTYGSVVNGGADTSSMKRLNMRAGNNYPPMDPRKGFGGPGIYDHTKPVTTVSEHRLDEFGKPQPEITDAQLELMMKPNPNTPGLRQNLVGRRYGAEYVSKHPTVDVAYDARPGAPPRMDPIYNARFKNVKKDGMARARSVADEDIFHPTTFDQPSVVTRRGGMSYGSMSY